MKKPILAAALALAMTAGVAAPAHAAATYDRSADIESYGNTFTCIPLYLIYLLVPALQSARSAN